MMLYVHAETVELCGTMRSFSYAELTSNGSAGALHCKLRLHWEASMLLTPLQRCSKH